MRNAFSQEITELAGVDQRIVLLSGDIGNRLFNDYKARYPDRFYNCGVAEANMTGVAAGMALCGLRPVTYTITAFNTVRCLEQIRVDVCYQNLPVIIVGVGGGLAYASLNATHHALEDIAFLRILPNMVVICPSDAWEVRAALREALKYEGPVYIRLGKKNEPLIHQGLPEFEIGRGIAIRSGKDICLLSTGHIMPTTLKAADDLGKAGLSVKVVSFHTVKPLDEELLNDVFGAFPLVVTLEEHSILGGFGGYVAEWLADRALPKARLLRVGTEDAFIYCAGDRDHAHRHFGLGSDQVASKILRAYRELKPI
jgi:transketolase